MGGGGVVVKYVFFLRDGGCIEAAVSAASLQTIPPFYLLDASHAYLVPPMICHCVQLFTLTITSCTDPSCSILKGSLVSQMANSPV